MGKAGAIPRPADPNERALVSVANPSTATKTAKAVTTLIFCVERRENITISIIQGCSDLLVAGAGIVRRYTLSGPKPAIPATMDGEIYF
jgi:hypothetical protein